MGVSEGALGGLSRASFEVLLPVYFFHPICAWEALLACSFHSNNMKNVPQSPRNSPGSHKSPRSSACAGLRLCSRSPSA